MERNKEITELLNAMFMLDVKMVEELLTSYKYNPEFVDTRCDEPGEPSFSFKPIKTIPIAWDWLIGDPES